MNRGARLTRRFFRRDPVTLARALLGHKLVRVLEDGAVLSGRIVEVEAYLGAPDRAAHSFGGRHTRRNHAMYLDGGTAYVYFTYGMHWCVNVVAGRANVPTACLIRALEPLEGLDQMKKHRVGKLAAERIRKEDLCSGPAKLTQALVIDRRFDGADLVTSKDLFLERGRKLHPSKLGTGPRIGVAYAKEWASEPLRFYERDSRFVSARSANSKPGGRR